MKAEKLKKKATAYIYVSKHTHTHACMWCRLNHVAVSNENLKTNIYA